MKVKEAFKLIETIDSSIKNLQKLLNLSADEQLKLEEKTKIEGDIKNTINIAVNSMGAYKNVLKDKIYDSEVEGL